MGKAPWLGRTEPLLMGILNITPDSFSDGGELLRIDDVLRRAEAMLESGAGLLDVGAVSTRPGAQPVDEAEELRRLVGPLRTLIDRGFGPISVDTYRPGVARAALDLGAAMINDVRAAAEPGMAELMGERQPWVCLMHMRGRPESMQMGDLGPRERVAQDHEALAVAVDRVVAAGCPREQILVDPGIGFGKTDDQNIAHTTGLRKLAQRCGCGTLYGASRKSLIGRIAGVEEPKERLPGSLALAGAARRAGAAVIRVHDVAETAQYLAICRALEAGG